ncbi:hypothetical protein LSAT2_020730 [Lamellibrachia satsuma]|nr:hypothetical protein LSAT2_020730 [Lamellibrachia satsuma]
MRRLEECSHAWTWMSCVLWLSVSVTTLPTGAYPELTVSGCFNQSSKTLTMTCDPGHMIRVLSAYYGHSESGQCSGQPRDCTMELPDTERYPCVGQHMCEVNLPSGWRGKYMRACQRDSTFMQLHYQCVPESDVMDICSHSVITKQMGFIQSPRYPHNYPNNQRCTLAIRLPDRNQRLHLYIIDMNLQKNDTDCADWLHTFDGYRSNTVCSSRVRHHLLTTLENHLVVEFQSDASVRQKGFWLYYEAVPYKYTRFHPGPSDHTVSTPRVWSVKPTDKGSFKLNQSRDATQNKTGGDIWHHVSFLFQSRFQSVLLVGSILMIILIISIVVLCLLIFKRQESMCVLAASFSCTSPTETEPSPLATRKVHNYTNSGIQQSLAQEILQSLTQGILQSLTQGILQSLTQGILQSLAQGILQSLTQGILQSLTQGILQSLTQGILQSLTQGILQSMTHWILQSLTQGILQSLTQGILQSLTQGILQSLTQGILQSLTQGILQLLAQGILQSLTQGILQSLTQGILQSLIKGILQPLTQGILQSLAQGILQSRAQGILQSLAQGILQSLTQEILQSLTQGILQSLTQGILQSLTQGILQSLTQGILQSLIQEILQSLTQGILQSLAQGILQSLTHGILQSLTQGILQLLTQGIQQSLTQGILQSLTQGIVQSLTQGILQSMTQGILQSLTTVMCICCQHDPLET